MISAGSIVSAGAKQAGVDPEVAHAAGAAANIVTLNYVGAAWEVAQLVGHLTGILGGDDNVHIKASEEQKQSIMLGQAFVPTPEQWAAIAPKLNEEEKRQWGELLLTRNNMTPEEVAAILGPDALQQQQQVPGAVIAAPAVIAALSAPPAEKTNWTQGDFAAFLAQRLSSAPTPADVAAQKGVPLDVPAAAPPAAAPVPSPQDLMRASLSAEGYNEQQIAAHIAAYDADQARISQLVAQGHAPDKAAVTMLAEKEAQAAAAALAAQQAEEKRVNDLIAQGNSFGNALAIVADQNVQAAAAQPGFVNDAVAINSMG